jgi:ribosomal protein L11 methyltransferase
VGETPLWQAIRLTGLFPADSDMDAVLADLPARSEARVELLEDRDWSREWMQHYRPMRFGERLWICPSWTAPPEPDATNLFLDPGLAFGTGTHPTTAMCLAAVDRLIRGGERVVDYGCGSGILGIAALRLGAGALLAVDNDPQALAATKDNAARNAVGSRDITVALPQAYDPRPWQAESDVVFANILAGPLASLAPQLCAFLAPGGTLVMAGLLETQVPSLAEAFAPFLRLEAIDQVDEWVCLGGRRD